MRYAKIRKANQDEEQNQTTTNIIYMDNYLQQQQTFKPGPFQKLKLNNKVKIA